MEIPVYLTIRELTVLVSTLRVNIQTLNYCLNNTTDPDARTRYKEAISNKENLLKKLQNYLPL